MKLLVLLALCTATQAAEPSERIRPLIADLARGGWNVRIHATHSLEAFGVDGLPGLRAAARDADWQVRMTAVHLMGRIGAPALPDLDAVLRQEPCRHVRLTAVHWLGAIGGPEAEAVLRRELSDESGMVRLVGRYWLAKAETSRQTKLDPDAETAASEDLKRCASSPPPGRAPWADPSPKIIPTEPEEIDEPVITPDPTPKTVTTPNRPGPETLPGQFSLPVRAKAEYATVSAETLDRARLEELDVLLSRSTGTPETFPDAPPGPANRPEMKTRGADFAGDDGSGKAPTDPLPVLIELLLRPDAAKRARAADEIGKRGASAASAISPLAEVLKDGEPRVRAAAALALGNIGPAADSAVPALVAALKRGPEEVEWSAAIALGRIGTSRARKAFAKYSRDSAAVLAGQGPRAASER